MPEKNKMVDFPDYDPDKRVPFPPGGSPFGQTPPQKRTPEEPQQKKPFYEEYDPDPVTPDPSQTTPGAIDIRDPHAKPPSDDELGKYSPDIEHKK